jgi:hypothetical protein
VSAECGQRATLIVTLTPSGTATNVARRRVALKCSLPASHSGAHRDSEHDERWDARPGETPTLVRHEEDEP